jgi:hypothetical protein
MKCRKTNGLRSEFGTAGPAIPGSGSPKRARLTMILWMDVTSRVFDSRVEDLFF